MTAPSLLARPVLKPDSAPKTGKLPECSKTIPLTRVGSIFPVRGQPDHDREFRHPRVRAEKTARRDPAKVRREILDAPVRPLGKPSDEWERLPPLPDIIDGVNRFTQHYFQLGFIPKQQFPDRLLKDYRSVSVFLVVSILSISARLSPSLATRYGSGMKAAEFFMERATNLAYGELYQEPTLERCQAFYLLSIAQQGSGLRNKSYVSEVKVSSVFTTNVTD